MDEKGSGTCYKLKKIVNINTPVLHICTCQGLKAMYPERFCLEHFDAAGSWYWRDLGCNSVDTTTGSKALEILFVER